MPVFACTRCNAAENTALCGYWERRYAQQRAVFKDPSALTSPPLCSACDPALRKWHACFPRLSAAGLLLGADGFLYTQPPRHTTIVGKVGEPGAP